jgi:DMSO/TMAO reductase YedYZ molybdopterin-dependent catalytic subunit
MKAARSLLIVLAVLVAACSSAPASAPVSAPATSGPSAPIAPPTLVESALPVVDEGSAVPEASADTEGSIVPDGSVEIREYKGVDLSAVTEVKNNAATVPPVSVDTYRLRITGLVETPLELTYDQVLAFAHHARVVTLFCIDGWHATILWEGLQVEDLLAAAGVRDGAQSVVFRALDGYASPLSLALIRKNHILLAFRMNGLALSPERGFPFQVVAESQWGYHWVKWVDEIELSAKPA